MSDKFVPYGQVALITLPADGSMYRVCTNPSFRDGRPFVVRVRDGKHLGMFEESCVVPFKGKAKQVAQLNEDLRIGAARVRFYHLGAQLKYWLQRKLS